MVQLYLDGNEIVMSVNQTVNISKENPYFTVSESYSLNVEIPLDIPENVKFFGNIGRLDARKRFRTFDALLTSNFGVVIKGLARIVKSTERLVKLQITSGVSAVKMVADMSDMYIDTVDLGRTPTGKYPDQVNRLDEGECYDTGGMPMHSIGIPFYDATNGVAVNICDFLYRGVAAFDRGIYYARKYVSMCPSLIDVLTNVFDVAGFSLDTSSIDEAAKSIFIITGIHSSEVSAKLPHWTVGKFIEEVQNFLACTFVSDGMTVKMVPISNLTKGHVTVIDPEEQFEVDYSEKEEVKGIMNSNVEYAIDANNDEVVDGDIIDAALSRQQFMNYELAKASFGLNPDDYIRRRTIYEVGGAMYVGWDDSLRRIGPFNPLKRYADADTVKLNICPVKMIEMYDHELFGGEGCENHVVVNIPVIDNPTPIKERDFTNWEPERQSVPSLQELLSGEEEIMENKGKADIMPVVFVGKGLKKVLVTSLLESGDKHILTKNGETYVSLGFTDWRYKEEDGLAREKWSFSLHDVKDCDFCIGRLHVLPYQTNRKCRQEVKFLSKTIPSATDIFVIRNRRYACEKIDMSIVNGEVSPLMTGHFYELIE